MAILRAMSGNMRQNLMIALPAGTSLLVEGPTGNGHMVAGGILIDQDPRHYSGTC